MGTPITTTYSNDNTGLSQVLVSDNGATTTANLFGLDLIHQDDGTDTRTLLTDGLGSVRVEMVGNAVETTTTYEPYGKLLTQSGSSSTTYGYTGEQHNNATGLVYLRARYYDPSLKVFLSHDPFPGYANRSSTQHGYSYVSNNPVNRTDPSGLCEEYLPDESCWAIYEEIIRRYPEAPYMNLPMWYGFPDHQLHELPAATLEGILRNFNESYTPGINPILDSGVTGINSIIRYFEVYNGPADERLILALKVVPRNRV